MAITERRRRREEQHHDDQARQIAEAYDSHETPHKAAGDIRQLLAKGEEFKKLLEAELEILDLIEEALAEFNRNLKLISETVHKSEGISVELLDELCKLKMLSERIREMHSRIKGLRCMFFKALHLRLCDVFQNHTRRFLVSTFRLLAWGP